MKKTYATSMPNRIGAFLKASKCVATLGLNITRVSYDKSVDSHMLFLDVEGTPEQIAKADDELEKIGYFDFGDLHFEVWEGKGGHLPGEVVLIDHQNKLAFTGDVYVNMHGMTAAQTEYNQHAPILMTSVDTDLKLCSKERLAIMQLLGAGEWKIFGAHGAPKDYSVP